MTKIIFYSYLLCMCVCVQTPVAEVQIWAPRYGVLCNIRTTKPAEAETHLQYNMFYYLTSWKYISWHHQVSVHGVLCQHTCVMHVWDSVLVWELLCKSAFRWQHSTFITKLMERLLQFFKKKYLKVLQLQLHYLRTAEHSRHVQGQRIMLFVVRDMHQTGTQQERMTSHQAH